MRPIGSKSARSLALKMKHCVSHLFGELVSTRHADLLGRGRTVQLEEVVEADVSPGGGDRVSDGEEDGGREEQRRLTDRLVETAWLESLILKVKLLQSSKILHFPLIVFRTIYFLPEEGIAIT